MFNLKKDDEYIKIGCTRPDMSSKGFFIPCSSCKVRAFCDKTVKEFKGDRVYIKVISK